MGFSQPGNQLRAAITSIIIISDELWEPNDTVYVVQCSILFNAIFLHSEAKKNTQDRNVHIYLLL